MCRVRSIVTPTFASCALVGCALSQAGPTGAAVNQFLSNSHSGALYVPITEQVAESVSAERGSDIPPWVHAGRAVTQDLILPGDRLTVTIYENVEDGLLSNNGQPATVSELQVESSGMVTLPYAGRIRAAGNTTEAVRNIIFRTLSEQTPNPEVLIRRELGAAASVSILGSGGGGTFPFDSSTSTLMRALSVAGALVENAATTSIILIRGERRAAIPMARLLEGTIDDVNLRPRDVVLLEESHPQFVALGYLGSQALVDIPSHDFSLIEAIAQIGGLDTTTSNPSGVFVFRREDREAVQRLGQEASEPEVSIAYGLDMRDPESLLAASIFLIENDDVIYVTQAPFARLTTILNSIVTPAQSVRGIAR